MLMAVDFTPATAALAPIEGRAWYALRMDTRGMMPQTTERLERAGADRVVFPAQLGLERRGYLTFVPTERWSRRKNRFTRQRVFTTRALVPGLLLASVPVEDANWFEVMSTPWVRGVYGALRPVGSRDLDGVNTMVGAATELIADPFSLRPGDRVTLPSDNPLAGQEVELTEVLVDVPEPVAKGIATLFGGTVEIEVPINRLHGVRKDA